MEKKDYRAKEYHKLIWRAAYLETKSKLFGDIWNLSGNFIVAIISGLGYASWSYFKAGTIIDWAGVVISVVIGFLGWGVIIFCINLFWITPAILYREKEREADRYNFNNVDVDAITFGDKKDFVGYGIRIENNKEIILSNVAVELIYLEIDDKVINTMPSRDNNEFTRYRFPEFNQGQYDGNTFSMVSGQKIQVIFLDRITKQNKDIFRILYCVPDVSSKHGFKTIMISIERQARCELVVYAKVQNQLLDGGNEHSFEVKIENNKPVFSYSKEKLKYYRHESGSETENSSK